MSTVCAEAEQSHHGVFDGLELVSRDAGDLRADAFALDCR